MSSGSLAPEPTLPIHHTTPTNNRSAARFLQVRILEWLPCSPGDLPDPEMDPPRMSPALAGRSLPPAWEAWPRARTGISAFAEPERCTQMATGEGRPTRRGRQPRRTSPRAASLPPPFAGSKWPTWFSTRVIITSSRWLRRKHRRLASIFLGVPEASLSFFSAKKKEECRLSPQLGHLLPFSLQVW